MMFFFYFLGGIAGEVYGVIRDANKATTGVPPYPGQCGTMQAQWSDGWIAPHRKIPDAWWIRSANWLAINPTVNCILPGVPDFVLEVISPSEPPFGQILKMGEWIKAGVQFGIFVDYLNRVTYRYARASSNLLPAPGAHANVAAHPFFSYITQEQFPWPPLVVAIPQYGPAGFVVSIPAGTLIGIAVGGAINIDHGEFLLG